MIDVTKLKHQDDVRKDFFGKWNHSGSHPLPFKARVTDDDEVEVEKCEATIRQTLTFDECLLLFQVRYIALSANKHMHTYSIWDHVNIFLRGK